MRRNHIIPFHKSMNHKKKDKLVKWLIGIVLLVIGAVYNYYRQPEEVTGMEIPVVKGERQGQLICHTGHTLSYNSRTRTPQWVAWELTKAETHGDEERSTEFLPDPKVIGIPVETYDYSRSGYDRGHMAPAGDMKWDRQAMQESFYLSNICPQDHNLNKGDWNDLEIKTREWARRYGKAYIVCGPVYREGESIEYIGTHRVAVPHAFFKAILLYQAENPVVMGFYFENKAGHRRLQDRLVSIDELETLTGMDFFSLLPDEVENRIESEVVERLP